MYACCYVYAYSSLCAPVKFGVTIQVIIVSLVQKQANLIRRLSACPLKIGTYDISLAIFQPFWAYEKVVIVIIASCPIVPCFERDNSIYVSLEEVGADWGGVLSGIAFVALDQLPKFDIINKLLMYEICRWYAAINRGAACYLDLLLYHNPCECFFCIRVDCSTKCSHYIKL